MRLSLSAAASVLLFLFFCVSCTCLEDEPEPLTPPFQESVDRQSAENAGKPVKDTDAVNMMITDLTMTLVSRGGSVRFAISGRSNAKKLAFRVMQKMVEQKLAEYATEPDHTVGSFVNEKLEWTLRIVKADSGKRIFSKTILLQAKENFGKNKP